MEFHVRLMVALLLWAAAAGRGSALPAWLSKMWDQVTGTSQQSAGPETSSDMEPISLFWGIPDTGATVGHIFKYQIPHSAFSSKVEEYVVTEAGYPELPLWLCFNSSSETFFGVAAPLDLGATAIEVTAFTNNKTFSVSTHFIVKVQAAGHPLSGWSGEHGLTNHLTYHSYKNHDTMDKSPEQCQWDQNTYRAVLLLDSALNKLSASRRVELLYKSARFLSQSVHSMYIGPKKSDSITRLMDTTTISAGAGDTVNNQTDTGVELSWVVGCSSFSGAGDLAKVLQHNILVGRIRKELGYKVIGWLITETLPPEPLRKLSRQKRQVRATPMPTPTLASSMPSIVTDMTTLSVIETTVETVTLSTVATSSEASEPSGTVFLTTSTIDSTISTSETSSAVSDILPTSVVSEDATQSTEISETPSSPIETQFSTYVTSLEMSSLFVETIFATSAASTELLESVSPSLTVSLEQSVFPSATVESTESFFFESSSELPEQSTSMLLPSEISIISSEDATTSLIPDETESVEASSVMFDESSEMFDESSEIFETIQPSPTVLLTYTTLLDSDFQSSATVPTAEYTEITSSLDILSTPASSSVQLMTSVETELITSDLISPTNDGEISSTVEELDSSDIFSSSQIQLSSSEFIPNTATSSLSASDTVLESTSLIPPSMSSSSIIDPSLPVTVDVSQSSLLDMQTELPTTFLETIVPTIETSREASETEQSSVITPSMSSSSIVESMVDSPSVSNTEGQLSTDSIVQSLTVSITSSSSLEPGISSSTVLVIPPLISSEIIDETTATERQTSVLTSSFEPVMSSESISLSTSSIMSSSSSPVTSSPTSPIVNLVTITPSPGQTLNVVPFPTSLFQEESSPTLSTISPTSLVPMTTTSSFQTTSITLNPESSSTLVLTPSSSSIDFPVLSTSTVLLLPSSTVLPTSYVTSVPSASPTSFVSGAVTEVPPLTTLLPSVPSEMTTSPIRVSSASSTVTVSSTLTTSIVTVSTTPKVTTTPANTPPRLIRPIDQINTQLGVYFEYPVPADSFYDQEDGNTRALQLTLLTLARRPLGPDSWVQFDPESQTVFGIPLKKDLPRTEADKEFVLVAEDSRGLQVQEALKVVIDESSVVNLTHQFTVTVDEEYTSFVTMTTNLINLITTVANFLGDDKPTNMTVTNVTSGSVEVHWSNNTLSKTVCENETIQRLYEELSGGGKINPDFRRATFPRYNVLDVGVRYQGACVVIPVGPTPAPPVEPPVLSSTDSSIYYKTIVPAVLLALLLLLAVLICICLQRRRRLAGRLLLDDEKPIFAKDRHPVLLESELEMRDIHRKPHRPIVLSDDSAYANPAFVLPAARRPLAAARPTPARPPPYRIPDDFSPFFDDDFDGASISPPPDYASDGAGVYSRPPPAYRLPPPYSSQGTSSEA